MTSRERVLQATSFQQPERVAIDFGGHASSGIMALAYKRLRDYLELPPRPIKVYHIPQQLAVIDDDVLERFHIDVVELGRLYYLEDTGWKPWRLPDGTECLIPEYVDVIRKDGAWVIHHPDGTPIALQKEGMIYFEQTCWALAERLEEKLERLEEMFQYNMWMALPTPLGHIPLDDRGLAQLASYARRVRTSEQRAIIGLFGGSLFETGQMLWGIQNYMQALVLHPALVERFLDLMLEIYKRDLDRFLRAVGQSIDIILFSDDYGMQTGSLISPTMFRRFFKARHQELWQYAKKRASVKVMLHSCGSIANLLPDMIEAGLDIVQPVQTSSKNMQATALKSQFGKQLVLWGGGCDTQRVLGMGTPADVRQNVFDNLDVLAPGGGFVFQQVHNIMANVPPENIVAMFDAVAEWNRLHPG